MMIASLGWLDLKKLILVRKPKILESPALDGADRFLIKIINLILAGIFIRICPENFKYQVDVFFPKLLMVIIEYLELFILNTATLQNSVLTRLFPYTQRKQVMSHGIEPCMDNFVIHRKDKDILKIV